VGANVVLLSSNGRCVGAHEVEPVARHDLTTIVTLATIMNVATAKNHGTFPASQATALSQATRMTLLW